MTEPTTVAALIKQIAGDEELRNNLLAAADTDRAAMIAELGFADITPADVAAAAAVYVPELIAEIDESELDALAGGGHGSTQTTVTTMTTLAASAVASVAT